MKRLSLLYITAKRDCNIEWNMEEENFLKGDGPVYLLLDHKVIYGITTSRVLQNVEYCTDC
jgi:hypothetical protein